MLILSSLKIIFVFKESKTCKSYHYNNISYIEKVLTPQVMEPMIHTIIQNNILHNKPIIRILFSHKNCKGIIAQNKRERHTYVIIFALFLSYKQLQRVTDVVWIVAATAFGAAQRISL